MPLILPENDESRDAFIERTSSLDLMAAEYPDKGQRESVCGKIFDNQKEFKKAAFSIVNGEAPAPRTIAKFKSYGNGHTWDAEVFAAGTWNGYPFSESDLDEIVRAFKALNDGGYLDVPLKFGHNNEQKMTDGTPAIGWVTDLYVKKDGKDRTKLMAKFDDVPDVVYNAASKGLYKQVSIELDMDVTHKGDKYPYVMTGIALLGADLPAVNTLSDLNAYMGRDSLVSASRAAFSAVNGSLPKEEEKKMAEIDDKELDALRASAAKAEDNEAKLAQFTADQKAKDVKTAREAVTDRLDQAVKDMQITPAQRASFAKVLRVDDDDAVLALNVADVESLLPEKEEKEKTFGRNSQDRSESTDDILDQSARKIIAENGGKMAYSRALELAMMADPETAKAHRGIGA